MWQQKKPGVAADPLDAAFEAQLKKGNVEGAAAEEEAKKNSKKNAKKKKK